MPLCLADAAHRTVKLASFCTGKGMRCAFSWCGRYSKSSFDVRPIITHCRHSMWKPNDPAERKYISYTGPLPSRLYRYRTVSRSNLDRLIEFEILDEAIYLAGMGELNDPDEGRFRITFGDCYEDMLSYWREAIAQYMPTLSRGQVEAQARNNADETVASGYQPPDRVIDYTRRTLEKLVRVACFTTQPTNYSMWANYAKYFDDEGQAHDHAGVCIEYICDEAWRITTLYPVEYSDQVPEVNVVADIELEVVRAMYQKSREWRGEEEWRITSVIQSMPPFPSNLTVNSKIKIEGAVSSVIFGMKTPENLVSEIQARVSASKPEMSFRKVVRDARTFDRKIVDL